MSIGASLQSLFQGKREKIAGSQRKANAAVQRKR